MTWLKTAGLSLSLCLSVSGIARAELPGDCTGLGVAITEHSCFHSEFGPFTTVMATAGTAATPQTADVSPVHTQYRVGLAGEYSVISYTPKRSGAWAVLLGNDVPVQVLPTQGQALASMLDQSGDTGCQALPLLHVFELKANTKYRLIFGPTAAETAVVVIEYIDDFLTENGRDADGDGFGSKHDVLVTPCVPPEGYAPNTRDCDDGDPLVNPNATEVCDGVDQNCNGVADDVGLACRVGIGGCRVEGKTECPNAGEAVVCSAAPLSGTAESCNGLDDDCNGKIDDAAGLCPSPDRPTCVRNGMSATCGCQLDLDCGSVTSGRICNVAKGVCEQGCSAEPGRNGCEQGATCKQGRCELLQGQGQGGEGGAPGAALPSGGAPDGAPGPSPDPDSNLPTEGGAGNVDVTDSTSKTTRGGCDCAVTGLRVPAGGGPLFALVISALWLRRRKRPPRPVGALVVAGLTWGCGGRVQEVLPSAAGGTAASSGGAETGTPNDRGGAATAGLNQGGAGGQPPPACVKALGSELVEHACSHVTNGPFVSVVAGGSIAPPDVSELHHAYEVQIVEAGARVHYRAQRHGDHAFMSDVPVGLSLSQAGKSLKAQPSFAVNGCSHLTRAAVYHLEPETEYEIQFAESSLELELFVEHLGAFGAEAWSESCGQEEETEE